MKKTALVIMAAGIGSRFGKGIKQLAPVGPNGEIIMDYSIYDALEAGFNKVVFIIRKDIEKEFKEVIVKHFIDEYMKGRTPNPCVMCNPLFKERILCEWADQTNCAHISTGHYCRRGETMTNSRGEEYAPLLRGLDQNKDR